MSPTADGGGIVMPQVPRFCAHCGAELIEREVEHRLRQVCPVCDTIFYRNPLPVASAVVINGKREVLLVKRAQEPSKGMWCLPIGFAELDETIAEAALRELREEAGIEGEIVRLLDACSQASDFYGDLLVVTFQVRKVGGLESAGDDAEQTGYFPLSGLPELAFESNRKAIALFRAGLIDCDCENNESSE